MLSSREWMWLLIAILFILGIALAVIYLKNQSEERKCMK